MIPTCVVVNQRGGVGKTTTALALAHYLSRQRRRVLLLDLDGQDSITTILKLQKAEKTIFDVLESETPWRECVVPIDDHLSVLPADRRLGVIETLIGDRFRKQELLKAALADVSGFDAIVIDCSPSLSVLHANAFSAATDVVLPVSMDLLAISGANAVLAHLADFRRYCGYGPVVAGVLPTLYDRRQKIDKELLPVVQKAFAAVHVFDAIRVDTRIKRATLRGGDLFSFKEDKGVAEYARFAAAFVARRWPELRLNGTTREASHVSLA